MAEWEGRPVPGREQMTQMYLQWMRIQRHCFTWDLGRKWEVSKGGHRVSWVLYSWYLVQGRNRKKLKGHGYSIFFILYVIWHWHFLQESEILSTSVMESFIEKQTKLLEMQPTEAPGKDPEQIPKACMDGYLSDAAVPAQDLRSGDPGTWQDLHPHREGRQGVTVRIHWCNFFCVQLSKLCVKHQCLRYCAESWDTKKNLTQSPELSQTGARDKNREFWSSKIRSMNIILSYVIFAMVWHLWTPLTYELSFVSLVPLSWFSLYLSCDLFSVPFVGSLSSLPELFFWLSVLTLYTPPEWSHLYSWF